MRGGPGELLNVDADAGMRTLEFAQQLCHHLAFAAHRPKADDDIARRRAAGRRKRKYEKDQGSCPAHAGCCRDSRPFQRDADSHPPVNPARSSPRRRYGFLRIEFQTMPLR